MFSTNRLAQSHMPAAPVREVGELTLQSRPSYAHSDVNEWIRLEREFQEQLTSEERSTLSGVSDKNDLDATISKLQRQHTALRNDQASDRLSHIINMVGPVADAADVLTSGLCLPSKSLWGALGLIVSLSSSKSEFLDAIMSAFECALEGLPRMVSYQEALPESPSLRVAIQRVFDEYLSVTVQCVKFFGRNKSATLNPLRKIKWRHYTERLEQSRQELEQLKLKVQEEAGYALKQQTEKTEVERFDNLMSAIREDKSRASHQADQSSMFLPPYPRSHIFTGRQKSLQEIHQSIDPEQEGDRQHVVVLHGLGGVGKTQIALEYTYAYREQYEACFWITCDTPIRINESISAMAATIGIKDEEPSQMKASVKKWMSTSNIQWLLVLDNVTTMDDVKQIWPAVGGSIIITTQDSRWTHSENISKSINVQSMTDEEGVAMVKGIFTHHGKSISTVAAAKILSETGGLPLAIRHLGSYICANEEDPEEFINEYREDPDHYNRWDDSVAESCPRTLANFLDFAHQKLSPKDSMILAACCFLDSEKIEEKLLIGTFVESTRPKFQRKVHYRDSMSIIRRYSLITKQSQPTEQMAYSVHRQVKRYLLGRLSESELREAFESLVDYLGSLLPPETPWQLELADRKWTHVREVPHVSALGRELWRVREYVKEPKSVARLLLFASFDMWITGVPEEGQALLSEAESLCDMQGFDDQMLHAEILSIRGSILGDIGHLDEALACFEKCKSIQQQRSRDVPKSLWTTQDDLFMANAYNNLAGIHLSMGNYQTACIYGEVSLGLKQRHEKELPLSHLMCLSYLNLASALAMMGKQDEAATNFELALSAGTGEATVARLALTYHNYGCMRLNQGLYMEALELLESAFRIRDKLLGDHHDTAATLYMLAICHLHSQGLSEEEKLAVAEDCLSESVRILKTKDSNFDRRFLARSLFKQSEVLTEMGEDTATAIGLEAQALYQQLTSGDMPKGEDSYNTLVPYV